METLLLTYSKEVQVRFIYQKGDNFNCFYGDANTILSIKHLQNGHIINGECHANLLIQLGKAVKNKQGKTVKNNRQGKRTNRVLFHMDNAPAHTSLFSIATVRVCCFELVDHCPCAP